jgi:hypothetical protein
VIHSPLFRSLRYPALLAAGAMLLASCGLSEYTGQMSSEAVHARNWDEESKLVAPPLKMPELPLKDGKEQIWTAFLRPPRGVQADPVTQGEQSFAKLRGSLAQYTGGGPFGIQNVYLGVVGEQKDYLNTVCSQFTATWSKEEVVTLPRSPTLLAGAPKAAPQVIELRRKTGEGQSYYSVNVYNHDGIQVAVVYEVEKGAETKSVPAIKASLATLAEGGEAGAFTKEYTKTNRKAAKK